MQYSQQDIFDRSRLLLGKKNMDKIRNKKIIIFGIGGVGSWTAESLIRTGITDLTIVDADKVATSNINRQVPATTDTVGTPKTDAMKKRLLTINPEATITAVAEIYSSETAEQFDLEKYDYIIDAIDSVADKALLIYNSTQARRPRLFSSMGAALKLDPMRIRSGEFHCVSGCRLAAALRRRFKKTGMHPRRKFRCVYSDELLPNLGAADTSSSSFPETSPMTFNKVATNGSLCHITAIFGMMLAGMVVQAIVKEE